MALTLTSSLSHSITHMPPASWYAPIPVPNMPPAVQSGVFSHAKIAPPSSFSRYRVSSSVSLRRNVPIILATVIMAVSSASTAAPLWIARTILASPSHMPRTSVIKSSKVIFPLATSSCSFDKNFFSARFSDSSILPSIFCQSVLSAVKFLASVAKSAVFAWSASPTLSAVCACIASLALAAWSASSARCAFTATSACFACSASAAFAAMSAFCACVASSTKLARSASFAFPASSAYFAVPASSAYCTLPAGVSLLLPPPTLFIMVVLPPPVPLKFSLRPLPGIIYDITFTSFILQKLSFARLQCRLQNLFRRQSAQNAGRAVSYRL